MNKARFLQREVSQSGLLFRTVLLKVNVYVFMHLPFSQDAILRSHSFFTARSHKNSPGGSNTFFKQIPVWAQKGNSRSWRDQSGFFSPDLTKVRLLPQVLTNGRNAADGLRTATKTRLRVYEV